MRPSVPQTEAAMANAAATLQQAIAALYHAHGEQQQRANQWLTAFQTQPESWEACVQLLDPAQGAEVCFFCANMLLAKVRAEWFKLPPEHRSQMHAVLGCVLYV